MGSPYLVVQLSDPHLGADWAPGDPAAGLAAAVESVRAMRIQPDALLVTGDLADGATDAQYDQVRELLAPLGVPAYVLPGNRDDRSTLRAHFDLPGAGAEPVCYCADLGPLRLVVLDSTIPGEDSGDLDDGQIKWLEGVLAASTEQPTLIAIHHPPLRTGVPAWDEIGLSETGRQRLAEVVARHRQVRLIVAGHVHRTIWGELAGRPVLSVPSTYVQGRLKFGSRELELSNEPAGFAVHALIDGELVSHIQPVV